MPELRIKLNFGLVQSGLRVFTLDQDNQLPLVNSDLILLPLEIQILEPGSYVHGEYIEADWTAELYATGKYIGDQDAVLSFAKRANEDKVYHLYVEGDRDNYIVVYTTSEDYATFPFNRSDKVIIQLQVTELRPDLDRLTAFLVPVGKLIDDVAICEITKQEESWTE